MQKPEGFKLIDEFSNELNVRLEDSKLYMSIGQIGEDAISSNFLLMDWQDVEKFKIFIDSIIKNKE